MVVKADKPLYEMEMGKMVVNISSSITAAGQTAIDMLEKSPGIFVNRQDGSLAIGGKNGVVVLINGKRSRMPMEAIFQMLDGMNAADIEKFEIMTVPPSNYDADGDAGFINIVLNKPPEGGTNGSLMLSAGHASGPQFGTSINVAHQQEKLSLFGNYSYNHRWQQQDFEINRSSVVNGESTFFGSFSDREPHRGIHNFGAGLDYSISDKTVIGVLIRGFDNFWDMRAVTEAQYQSSSAPDTSIITDVTEQNRWKQLMGNINIHHTFENGSKLSADLDYVTFTNSNPSTYDYRYYNDQGIETHQIQNRVWKDTPIHMWVSKVDYSHKFGENTSLDFGAKATLIELTNDVKLEELKDGNWTIVDRFSSYSDLTEDVWAGYASLKAKLDEKTTMNLGVRYEHTSTVLSTEQEYGIVNRNYGNYLPYRIHFKKNQSGQRYSNGCR